MTTTENTVAASTVARKYATNDLDVRLLTAYLMGTAEFFGTTGAQAQANVRTMLEYGGVEVGAAKMEYGFLTRR